MDRWPARLGRNPNGRSWSSDMWSVCKQVSPFTWRPWRADPARLTPLMEEVSREMELETRECRWQLDSFTAAAWFLHKLKLELDVEGSLIPSQTRTRTQHRRQLDSLAWQLDSFTATALSFKIDSQVSGGRWLEL